MPIVTSAQISVGPFFNGAMAQETTRQMTHKLGFAARTSEEVAQAVTDLASALLRHAGAGTLTFRLIDSGDRTGIEVEAEDHGPGMRDVFPEHDAAGGGEDGGLGTITRWMDEIEVSSTAALGRRILCRRWLGPVGPAAQPVIDHFWQIGVATRPCRRGAANGDAFIIRQCDGGLLVGVTDGLGHGEPAQKAALAAQAYVQAHYEMPLDELFRGCSRACRGTRGVVMALVRFESPTVMTLANVGNIEMRAWTGAEHFENVVQRGFLGAQEEHVRVQRLRWDPNWMLVLHSDGLRAQWQWSDFPGLEREPTQWVANRLLSALAKEDDDATILAVKSCGVQS
jgi:anti-sigma regulatory factor (Ser/Thr protein kinase)